MKFLKTAKSIYFFTILCLIGCKKNETTAVIPIENKKNVDSIYYVSAKSGLNSRRDPNGKVLFKYEYGHKLKIVERTGKFQEIKDGNKIIKGEWVGIKEGDQTFYLFDAFLSNKKLEKNTRNINGPKIFTTNNFGNDKEFVVLTDYRNYAVHYSDSTIFIPKKHIGKEFIKGNSINRSQFLKYANVKENDSVFIYSYKQNNITSYKVENLPIYAKLTPYHNEGQVYDQSDYYMGLGLPKKIEGLSFVTVSKTNPFNTSSIEPIVLKKTSDTDFPKVTLYRNDYYKLKEIQFSFKNYKFESKNNDLIFYLKQISYKKKYYESIRQMVITSKNHDVVYSNFFYESDGEEFYKHNLEDNEENNYFTGKIFKDLPPVFWGFMSYSFSCPNISLINKKKEIIPILCDNRH